MHATVLFLLVLGPLWLGIETYVVPLQIGSSRLALPRLHAFAMWLYVVGSGLVIAGYISGRPTGLGFSVSAPPAAPAGSAGACGRAC
jgi:cytochrome c oxidase subunit 1